MITNPTPSKTLMSPQLADLAVHQDPRQNGFLTVCVRSISALPSSQENDRQGLAASGLSWAASKVSLGEKFEVAAGSEAVSEGKVTGYTHISLHLNCAESCIQLA